MKKKCIVGVKIDLQLKYQMVWKILMCINERSKFKVIGSAVVFGVWGHGAACIAFHCSHMYGSKGYTYSPISLKSMS